MPVSPYLKGSVPDGIAQIQCEHATSHMSMADKQRTAEKSMGVERGQGSLTRSRIVIDGPSCFKLEENKQRG